MANSVIKIKFVNDIYTGAFVKFALKNLTNPGELSIYLEETWVGLRAGFGEVTTGIPTLIGGERSAINYFAAISLDFNSTNFYTISRELNIVTITVNSPYYGFHLPQSNGTVTFEIVNNTSDPFSVTSVNFLPADTNQCNRIKMSIQTSSLAIQMLSPVEVLSNNSNPLIIEVFRSQVGDIILKNVAGTQITRSFQSPDTLNASNFSLTINPSPNGGTVVINSINVSGLTLEYSLDNATWQSSNIYAGLIADSYTMHVRDNYGCSISLPFIVDEFGVQNPYFYISKSNSIRFANRITFGDSANYKNDENTLSCEVDVLVPYKEVQQFQSADIITTQFKSNYNSNIASVIKGDLTEVNVPVVKMTNNIGITDRRDARRYNLGGGRTGIYFVSGNIYDYNTGAIIGSHALNGNLPEWAISGNYVNMNNGWFLIEEIIYDESKNAEVLVITYPSTLLELIRVGSIFNRFNYEVYEFDIDMFNYIDQRIQVKLVNSSSSFPVITHLSEQLWIKVKHDDVMEIHYWNTTNTDIMYSTGIQHRIRLPFTKVSGRTDEESEVHKTDTNAILLNADLYEVDDFLFEPLTKELWRKACLALSHEKVLINDVGYVKNASLNTEGPLEDSNLYVLTATMIKTGGVYNSQNSGSLDYDGSAIEVPGLIETDSGYMRY